MEFKNKNATFYELQLIAFICVMFGMRSTFILLFMVCTSLNAQKVLRLEFNGTSNKTVVLKSSQNTIHNTLDSLKNIGYYTLELKPESLEKDTLEVDLGVKYKIKVRVKAIDSLNFEKKEYTVNNVDSLTEKIQNYWIARGYPFVAVNQKFLKLDKNTLWIELQTRPRKKRKIDKIKIVGYEKLSRGYVKHKLGLETSTTYNEIALQKIGDILNSSRLVTETRSVQSLFQEDTTTLFLYVKKKQSNYFDGIVGFGNDENGEFRLNGNVLLQLRNNFNAMEEINLRWQATPERNTNLDLNIYFPYLWGTALGSQTKLNILRQDSVFVSTRLQQRFSYTLTPQSNIGVDLGIENSNFVLGEQAQFNTTFSDYNKTIYGVSYEYLKSSKSLLQEPKLSVQTGGNRQQRSGDSLSVEQYGLHLRAHRLWNDHKKHILKTAIDGASLFSDDDNFVENELFRVGGFGSLRGFNEQSIVADSYLFGSLEYRFVPNDAFYIASFIDAGWVQNKINNANNQLLGVGIGFSFLTQVGVFNMSYAVGKFNDQPFDFTNSKVHFGILANF